MTRNIGRNRQNSTLRGFHLRINQSICFHAIRTRTEVGKIRIKSNDKTKHKFIFEYKNQYFYLYAGIALECDLL